MSWYRPNSPVQHQLQVPVAGFDYEDLGAEVDGLELQVG
jgi:hypothetical protein